MMETEIIAIGNSKGVRIPKAVLEQCGLKGKVEMHVEAGALVLRALKKPRKGWADAAKKAAKAGDGTLIWPGDMDDAYADEWQW